MNIHVTVLSELLITTLLLLYEFGSSPSSKSSFTSAVEPFFVACICVSTCIHLLYCSVYQCSHIQVCSFFLKAIVLRVLAFEAWHLLHVSHLLLLHHWTPLATTSLLSWCAAYHEQSVQLSYQPTCIYVHEYCWACWS